MRTSKYIAAAAALAAASLAGCTVHQTEPPALTGPSDLALSLSVTTSPQTISQNGSDTAVVTAKVFFTDPTGQTRPKANLPIRFDMRVNGVAQDYGTFSARNAVTGSDGMARTNYTAPPMPAGGNTGPGCNGLPGQCVTIVATTSDSTAATPSGATSTAETVITLTPPGVVLPPAGSPTASFTMTPTPVVKGSAATFDGSASSPGTGATGIATYSWSFGDGSTGSGKTVSHSYNTVATYSVTLTVTNDRGLSASTTQSLSVGGVDLPQADFVFSPTLPTTGQTVIFNADLAKAAAGHQLTSFSWNYGDGGTDSGMVVSHNFAAAGIYNVVLTVLDDLGQKATKSSSVTVTTPSGSGGGGGGALAANFTFSPSTPGLNQDVFFNATGSTAASGHSIVSYTWDFGDGNSGSGMTTTHQYSRAGTYTVTLVVKDDLNQTATGRTAVTISNTSAQIVAAFTFSPQNPSISGGTNTIFFDATSSSTTPGSSIVRYDWVWGDGSTSSNGGQFPSHTFAKAGIYVVRLTVTDSTSATATTTVNVTVSP